MIGDSIDGERRSSVRKLGALLVIAAALVAGCGDDDDGGAAAGDVDRYCELVGELDEAGSEAFAPLEADDSATEEDFAEAERQFLEDHEDDIDELRRVAPDEIRDDIDTLLEAQEARAEGGDQEEIDADVGDAEERIRAFEEQRCS